ncbi:MAG: NAD(P)H-hydrate epimerase [Gemmobacter sp.]
MIASIFFTARKPPAPSLRPDQHFRGAGTIGYGRCRRRATVDKVVMHKNCADSPHDGRHGKSCGRGMPEAVTSAQMRAIERAAIDGGAVSGAMLMERAGAGVVAAIQGRWPDLAALPRRAVVLCGPGNNGGDGFVVARLLREIGWTVGVLFLGRPGRQPPDAALQRDRWLGQDRILHSSPMFDTAFAEAIQAAMREGSDRHVVVVDALFGTGLTRAPLEAYRLIRDLHVSARALQECGVDVRRVAVDVPTGLHADTGSVLDAVVDGKPWAFPFAADLTVTFHAAKTGLLRGDGPRLCGGLVVADIGLGPWDPHRHDA